MSIFSSVYEAFVWGTYYLVEFIANLFVIIYIAHRMNWIGGGPRRVTEEIQPAQSNVQQTATLVSGVTDLLKTAKGAWTEMNAAGQPGTPGQAQQNIHVPVGVKK
jgi:hypothetical protein